ncbi:exodeoxyribonuclease V subunit beta, partial [uncultured Xylophilus sp.]|uniref:UvrD-helicase domain-containing protein n=1 Tax=uncultured Xylophilus sp. TaxID=296832 RepID=UPI0025CE7706
MNDLAYEHNGRRVPRERFYAIACDPRRSVAVEACAGAGKTWMLVSRIVRALLAGCAPHEILAITFTKKAAGEMRQRLQEWLADFATLTPEALASALRDRGVPQAEIEASAGPAGTPGLRKQLSNLQQMLFAAGRPVQVRTFHSWFAALLRTAPIAVLEQLGLPTSYDLLEDDSEAVARVWRRFHGAVLADDALHADFQELVAEHGRSQTQKALHAALQRRVEFTLADGAGAVDGAIAPWAALWPDMGTDHPLPADWLLAQRDALYAAARALGRASAKTFSAAGAALEVAATAGDAAGIRAALLTKEGEPRKFNDKLDGIDAVRHAQALVQRCGEAEAQHAAWLHHGRMARLVRLLVAEYAALKRERGWVDMNDVERAAQAMLSDTVLAGWVQQRLDARVRHLLVDEFQDTNPLQWQALQAWLSGYVGAGAGEAPSVFLVGDPKQSIYRFRRAEPQVFRAAQRFVIEGLGGDRLACDHTRRNATGVI